MLVVPHRAPPGPPPKLDSDDVNTEPKLAPHPPAQLPRRRLRNQPQLLLFLVAHLRLRPAIARRAPPGLDLDDHQRSPVWRNAHDVRLADADMEVACQDPKSTPPKVPGRDPLAPPTHR